MLCVCCAVALELCAQGNLVDVEAIQARVERPQLESAQDPLLKCTELNTQVLLLLVSWPRYDYSSYTAIHERDTAYACSGKSYHVISKVKAGKPKVPGTGIPELLLIQ